MLAVSAEQADYSLKMAERHHLGYDILVDEGNRVAHDYGLFTTPDESLRDFDEGPADDQGAHHTEGDPWLPLPATFVIAPQGRIVAARLLVDKRQRMEPDKVIEHLRVLQRR